MIRQLTLEEIKTDIAHAGQQCYSELGFPSIFNPEHFCNVWASFYENQVGTMLVKEENGNHQGFIGGIVYIDPFDRVLKAQEFVWYIKPAYRSPILAAELLLAFEEWAKGKQAIYTRIAAPSAKTPLGALLRRGGYRELETMFEREL